MGMATRNRRRRTLAAAISLAVHGALFLVLALRAGGSLISAGGAAGGPVGPIYAVMLSPPSPRLATQDASASRATSTKLKLHPTPRPDGTPMFSPDEADQFAALADRLSERSAARPPPRPTAMGQGSPAPDSAQLRTGRQPLANTDRAAEGAAQGAPSTGNLWGAVEPCWRNLGYRGQVSVTLEVTLDARGGLRGPPRVVRATSAVLTESRLRSEANALGALAACMPRGDLRFASASYRLEFPATP